MSMFWIKSCAVYKAALHRIEDISEKRKSAQIPMEQ